MTRFLRLAPSLFNLPEETIRSAVRHVLGVIAAGYGLAELRQLELNLPEEIEPLPTDQLPTRLAAVGIEPERAAPFVSALLNYLRQRLGSEVVATILDDCPGLDRFEARPRPSIPPA